MSASAAVAPAPETTTLATKFEFIVGDRPDQLKAGSSKKLRSHLSKRGWQVYLLQHNQASSSAAASSSSSAAADQAAQQREERSKRKKRKRHQHAITWDVDVREPGDPEYPESHDATPGPKRVESRFLDSLIRGGLLGVGALPMENAQPVQQLSIDYQLGGGRVDPFKTYPTPWQPYIPHLVDHYIVHMAVDIPELDEPGNKGLLRSRWFRLATTEISTFQVVLLLSAGNYITVKGGIAAEQGFNMDQLKMDAISSIKVAMSNQAIASSDSIIGAVAKMASFEAMHGDEESFRMHMNCVKKLVEMRGGLQKLGLGGLLRRMLIWIDLNGGFLLNSPRYWPGQTFAGNEEEIVEPNPERFIAI
ncbi:hypothetical protein TARUN_9445 [Trichoderma arundinaceum]|uniref:Uncharacterized protein n=1 Tax=Trichoderma arundinaceum TaxID=490622 RepID=A0A395N9K2_TRIAR|nr:hypothetical protein TARUN_9445 [Trichoderma arundinaceum]